MMKRILNFVVVCVGVAVCPGLLLAEGYPVREGLWEITTEAQIDGLPPEARAMMEQMNASVNTQGARQTMEIDDQFLSPEARAALEQADSGSYGQGEHAAPASPSYGGFPVAADGFPDMNAVMKQAGFTPEMMQAMQQGRPQDMMSPEDRAAMEQMQQNGGPEQEALTAMKEAGMTPEMQQALLEATRRNEAPDAAMQKKIQDHMKEQAYGRSGVDLAPKVTRTASGDAALSYEVPDDAADDRQDVRVHAKAGGGKGFQTVMTQCVSAADQVDMAPKGKRCDMTQGWSGDTYIVQGTCEDGTAVEARLTYSWDTMRGDVSVNGPEVKMKSRLTGRYLGACPSKT